MEIFNLVNGDRRRRRTRVVVCHQSGMGQPIQRTVVLGLLLLLVQTVISLSTKSNQNVIKDNPDYSGSGRGKQFKYIWGDALADPKAIGPDGNSYPWDLASKIASKQRNPRTLFAEEFGGADIGLINPETTRQILLKSFEAQEFGAGINSFFGSLSHSHHHHHAHGHQDNEYVDDSDSTTGTGSSRQGRLYSRQGNSYSINRNRSNKRSSYRSEDAPSPGSSQDHDHQTSSTTESPPQPQPPVMGGGGGGNSEGGCVPSRLCPSTYNTTAPLYGISLTSGQPVTIVQKFPDLLQQVVFQVCKTSECDVIHGECVQTYLPYLFLVIPLGPVTLTGQDYVLVESGCVCRPKYASKQDEPPSLPFIQAYNTTRERKRTTQG